MHCVRALMDSVATSIFMTPRLLKRLRISGGTHHHPRHDWRCDATCKGQPEHTDHSPVLRLSRNGGQIRRASRADAGAQFTTWLTVVSQRTSWHRLGSIDSLRSPGACGAEEMTPMTTVVASKVSETQMTTFWGAVGVFSHSEQCHLWHRRSQRPKMKSFWGAVWGYSHSEQPHSTIF